MSGPRIRKLTLRNVEIKRGKRDKEYKKLIQKEKTKDLAFLKNKMCSCTLVDRLQEKKKMSQEEILPLTLINEEGKQTHMHTKVPDDIINENKSRTSKYRMALIFAFII